MKIIRNLLLAAGAVVALSFMAPSEANAQIYIGRGPGYHSHNHYRSYYPGSYYYRSYRPHYHWHDTSHWDYSPGYHWRHGNHYHYEPGRFHWHHDGHWDRH